ncbi:MAG: MFS transporter [Pyrinomonadaceae bacterium]|nr:MFS transporter [Pyrinomonadaceae bacterium]
MTYRQLLAGNPDFRRLWFGQVISEIGDWLNNIAVLALTIELAGAGREGFAIALYAIARHLPLFLFGPLAGVTVDRADRKRVMIGADIARSVLALGFLAAARFSSLSMIYAVGASLFSVSAFFNAAKRAALPNIATEAQELLAANSLSASTTAATIAVGSALGGIVATSLGRDAVFIINALTFLLSAEMLRRIRAQTNRSANSVIDNEAAQIQRNRSAAQRRFVKSFRGALRQTAADFWRGLKYVRRDNVLSAIFIVAAGWGLGNGAARALYSVFGAQLGEQSGLHVARPIDFGISVLFVCMGVGGIVGAPLAKRFNRRIENDGMGAGLGRSLTLDGCCLIIFSLMPSLWSAGLTLIVREMNFAIWWTAQQTLMMRRTNNAFGGRVFASYETLTTLMMTGAMFLSGKFADLYGIRIVAAIGGIVITLSGLLWFALKPRWNDAEVETTAPNAKNLPA